MGSFFRRVRSTFFVHLFNNVKPQHLRPQKRVQNEKKKQNRRLEPRKHTKNPHIAPLFFGTMKLFETFWIAPKGHPFICFYILQHNGCRKIAKGPPFTFFGTVTLFKNLIKKFFWEIFSCPQRVPPSIFLFFAASWSFKKPEGSPLFNFEP